MKKAENENKIPALLSEMEKFKSEKTSMIGIGISSEILIASIQAKDVTLNGVSIPLRYPYRLKPYVVPESGTVVLCNLVYGQNIISFKYSSNLSYSDFIIALSEDSKKLIIPTLYSMSMGSCIVIVDEVKHILHHGETLDLPDTVNRIEVIFSK